MNTTSSDNVGLYECIAVFSTAGYRNVTLARYNVTSSEPQSAGTYYVLRVERGYSVSCVCMLDSVIILSIVRITHVCTCM